MGIALVIVLGVVVITVVSVLGDMASKIAQAKIKAREGSEGAAPASLERLESRVAQLETRIDEKDESIHKLQDELRFVTRMLEDKSGGGTLTS
jgi:hypothetical protein